MKYNLEKLMDLAEVLRVNGYEEVAEEIETYLLSSRKESLIDMYIKGIIKRLREDYPEVADTEQDWKEIEYVEDTVFENPKTKLANMLEGFEENQERVGFKDIVKYEEVHFVRDNVLSRRMVRGYQFIWLSNIEKCKERYNTYSYIKQWKWVKEKITRMPRVQDFTVSEWCNMLKKGRIDQHDLGFREVMRTTKNKGLPYPSVEEIKNELEEARKYIEGIKDIPEL